MSEKLRFVLVGCGRIATLHVSGYQDRDDAVLYGVYDKKKEVAEEFAKKYGIEKVYSSYEEVLEDETVVGVEILTPHYLHAPMAIEALSHHKNVSVQKPMALNLEECDAMIKAAKDNDVLLRVSENFVHYPPYKKMKEMIEKGEIGEIKGIRYKMNNCALRSTNTPGDKGRCSGIEGASELEETGWKVNVLSWAWRLNDTLAGGGPLVFDDGYHKFSIFYDLFGPIEKVNAWIDSTKIVGSVVQDAPAVIMWKYQDKKLYGVWDITSSDQMYIKSKYYTCDERLEVTGSRGILWLTRCTATLNPDLAPLIMYRDGQFIEFKDEPCDWQDSFTMSTHNFIDAVEKVAEPLLSGERGREVLKFALSAIESSCKGETVYLDNYQDKKTAKKRGILWMLFGKRKK